jgi:Kdo2-lipid IVA lauroyltransferase/acyltransferase
VKKLRYFFEIEIVRAVGWCLIRMPRHALLAFARLVGTLGYYVDGEGRATALENLRVAFPGQMTDQRRREVARDSYRNFARNFAELFWSPRLTSENLSSIVSTEEEDPISCAHAREKGALWLTAHLGCFELSSIIWGIRGVQMTTVAQDFKNPGLTPIFQNLRAHQNHTLIPQKAAVVRLIKVMSRGGSVAMLADLNIRPGRAATTIECFGLKTSVPKIHAMLAGRLGMMILPAVCLPREDGGYHLKTFAPICPTGAEDETESVQLCWNRFEMEIRKRPELWMWMYKHWRYLPSNEPDEAYPSYANVSIRFQRLLSIVSQSSPRKNG